jgi:hypothetical protein
MSRSLHRGSGTSALLFSPIDFNIDDQHVASGIFRHTRTVHSPVPVNRGMFRSSL